MVCPFSLHFQLRTVQPRYSTMFLLLDSLEKSLFCNSSYRTDLVSYADMPQLSSAAVGRLSSMIESGRFTLNEMAIASGCSIPSVVRARDNLRQFGTARSPRGRGGRPSRITQAIGAALQRLLFESPHQYLEEMRGFLLNEFSILVSTSTISRTLSRMRWSKKIMRRRAKERNPDLRDFYMYKISNLHSWQLIFVDESGCDKRAGLRRTGWSPRGVTPVQVDQFHRGKRYQILPAYCQDGLLLAKVFQGITDTEVFEDFIERLLSLCGRWPEPKSVLVMDNASIHHSARVKRMCQEAGVLLIYLPPYAPDFNPIEELYTWYKIKFRFRNDGIGTPLVAGIEAFRVSWERISDRRGARSSIVPPRGCCTIGLSARPVTRPP